MIIRDLRVDMYTLVFKMDNQQDLLYNTWKFAQYYVVGWMGGEFG